jgi:hypothetical protein
MLPHQGKGIGGVASQENLVFIPQYARQQQQIVLFIINDEHLETPGFHTPLLTDTLRRGNVYIL